MSDSVKDLAEGSREKSGDGVAGAVIAVASVLLLAAIVWFALDRIRVEEMRATVTAQRATVTAQSAQHATHLAQNGPTGAH